MLAGRKAVNEIQHGARHGWQIEIARLFQREPGNILKLAAVGGFQAGQRLGIGHQEAGIIAAMPGRRRDGARNITQAGEIGAQLPTLDPADNEAAFLERFPNRCMGECQGQAAAILSGLPRRCCEGTRDIGVQRPERPGAVVGAIDAPARKDPFVGHEIVAAGSAAHQDSRAWPIPAKEDQGGGIAGSGRGHADA